MTTHLNNSTKDKNKGGANPAADLIRQKLDTLYATEPSAIEEAKEIIGAKKKLSKHQAYMKQLTESGMSLAEIQTAWHTYYQKLNDADKHEVWQEFYEEHGKTSSSTAKTEPVAQQQQAPAIKSHSQQQAKKHSSRTRTVSDVKQKLLKNAQLSSARKLSNKQHFQSLLFGAGIGSLVVLALMFSFFNERFIAPFITPSRQVSSTPIIADSASTSGPPKIIIPKINVEIPVVYDEPSIEEKAVQQALERGVVHYATTPEPGQTGNAVIFGHSSNNILNKGQYKFAFVLLNRLENGDTFYLTHNNTRYAYRIFEKKIVKPTELGVLGATEKPSTVTLITCDPPGTTINRLVVVAEQISPDPSRNTASTATQATAQQPAIIPGNAPSLWQRVTDWLR